MISRTVSRTAASTARRPLSLWSKVPLAPPDKILGLNDAFNTDKATSKVNLGVGAYRDNAGKPYVLPSVKEAQKRMSTKNLNHEYAGIAGIQSFNDASIQFGYGVDSDAIKSGRIAAVQTLSGTGACRLAGEYIARFVGKGKKMYMPNPTWGNHIPIMKDAGLVPTTYRYFKPETRGFDFEGMISDVKSAEEGSAFLVHACAHNPTGCDPTKDQWNELSSAFKSKNHIVFFDCAYQGFASGDSEEDAYAIRRFVADGHHILLGQSYAKNFGLYGERVGALSVVTSSKEESDRVLSQLKVLIRPSYSNPPVYGARIVSEVLNDPALRAQWTTECKGMADRIIDMRKALQDELKRLGSSHSWKHITEQIGMFCFTGLTPKQVLRMREEFHIYCTDDGRISIAGLNTNNVAYVGNAIHQVTK